MDKLADGKCAYCGEIVYGAELVQEGELVYHRKCLDMTIKITNGQGVNKIEHNVHSG